VSALQNVPNMHCGIGLIFFFLYLILQLIVLAERRMRWAGHVARMGEERGCIVSW